VLPAFRGRGIACLFLQLILQDIERRNRRQAQQHLLTLDSIIDFDDERTHTWSFQSNASLRFWLSMGFEPVGMEHEGSLHLELHFSAQTASDFCTRRRSQGAFSTEQMKERIDELVRDFYVES
jgi:hypothetical protein